MKKSKRKTYKGTALVSTVLLVLCIAGILLYFLFSGSLFIKGTWYKKIYLTDKIVNELQNYLDDAAGGNEIDAQNYVPECYVALKMELNDDNTFSISIDDDSYEKCKLQAREALKGAVAELLNTRLNEAGLSTNKDADSLVKEATGMDPDEYFNEYGPVLIEDYDIMAEKYMKKGSYSIEKKMITMHDDLSGLESCNKFMISDKILVLDSGNGAEIYYRGLNDEE